MDRIYTRMKARFSSKDPIEIKRIAKADDMAMFIWQLINNGWRVFKHTDYDYHKAWDRIRELLEEHNINPDELIE